MAKCEEGYLCDVCGEDVAELADSDLYLRYVIGMVDPETLHTTLSGTSAATRRWPSSSWMTIFHRSRWRARSTSGSLTPVTSANGSSSSPAAGAGFTSCKAWSGSSTIRCPKCEHTGSSGRIGRRRCN